MRSITRICTISLTLALFALAAGVSRAQQLTAVTMPLKDGGADHWSFFGDQLVGVDVTRGILKMSAKVNAYSLTAGRFLWRQEIELGYKTNVVGPVVVTQTHQRRSRILLGNGPFTLLGADGPRWQLSCDQVGFMDLDNVSQLSPDRLVLIGSGSCQKGITDDVKIILVDGATGRIVWSHKAKGQWFDEPGGYWARVAALQGRGSGKTKVLQVRAYPLAPGPDGYHFIGSADADRLLVIGERMEVLGLADGAVLWRSPKGVDRLEGVYGPYVFLRDGDKLSAIKAGTGEPGWTMDLDRAGTTLYSAGDLLGIGEASPLGPNDLMVSESRVVSRVDLMTGQKRWTVRREHAAWQATTGALLVSSDNGVVAYDWDSGAQRWELKQDGSLRVFGDFTGPVGLLVDRGKKKDGEWVGPYSLFGVETATGRVVWSRTELDGKKIASFDEAIPGQVRLTSEAGRVENINIADGSPASFPAGVGIDRFVGYAAGAKALQCRDYAGTLVWERRGEISPNSEVLLSGDLVVWPAKSGDVEVISLSDGASRWKLDAGSSPRAYSDDARRYLVVPHSSSVSVVRLGS